MHWKTLIKMGKAALITPVYLSGAWALMISYQLFTETAVRTMIREVMVLWPQIGYWLTIRLDMLVFIIAFSWVFVISSVIPSMILGKNSGTIVQFVVVLTLTGSSLIIQDALFKNTGILVERILSYAIFLKNPLDAASYLSFPYILMLIVDIFGRVKKT